MPALPYRISDKAESFSYVHDIEAQEHARDGREGKAHDHWLLAEATAYEAEHLRNLLVRWKGKR